MYNLPGASSCTNLEIAHRLLAAWERFNAWVAERFYDLANRRYENDLPIVVTSNVHADHLAELWTRAELKRFPPVFAKKMRAPRYSKGPTSLVRRIIFSWE